MLDINKIDNISSYHSHKLNFFAVTKCAGTAIKASLLNHKISNSTALRYDDVYEHPEAVYITKDTAANMSDEWLNFSVIRHPYIRIQSLFKHFVLRDPSRLHELHPELPICNIDDFVKFIIYNTTEESCNHHMKSISSFLLDKNNVTIPDIVFDFDEEYKTVIDFLHSYGCTLQKANVSNIEVSLSVTSKRLIRERYSLDFETFYFGE